MRIRSTSLIWFMPGLLLCLGAAHAGATCWTLADPLGDAVVRRTDLGADGVLAPEQPLPDLLSCTWGLWQAVQPQVDPYTGNWAEHANLVRVDIELDGVVNPPGTLGGEFAYDPFRYGPNPLFGYIEFDLDGEDNTGGETASPDLRYLGAVARFGGMPDKKLYDDRVAFSGLDMDGNILSKPFVERSGEEFHIAFHGWEISSIQKNDPADQIFGAGDTWIISGWLFHRAHGYEPFSYACCSGFPGSYEPHVQLRFQHSIPTNRTTISLVYPFNNAGSAVLLGVDEEYPDFDAGNQNSIVEALEELAFAAAYPLPEWQSEPEFNLIRRWANRQDVAEEIHPSRWKLNVLIGTAYLWPQPNTYFVWTDVYPNPRVGDYDGDGRITDKDSKEFEDFIEDWDGVSGRDGDGVINGSVSLMGFGANFSIFDFNYDGRVDAMDRQLLPPSFVLPDMDEDGDVDMEDFGVLQLCLGLPVEQSDNCRKADMDGSGFVGPGEMGKFKACKSGAANPPPMGCDR